MQANSNPIRLHVVDALRGFAIVSIMLLHNIEHFDFYYVPENLPSWMLSLDKILWESLFFLFAGKSYAIFALLFGLTFLIQTDNQKKRGKEFMGRFAWRLLLLFAFGIINSAFFQGDILTIYAVLGIFLILFGRLNNKALILLIALLLLQPLEWFSVIEAINNQGIVVGDPESWTYFGNMYEYIPDGSVFEVIKGNLTNGKKAVLLWNYENGRFFYITALFLTGLLIGRKKLFETNDKNNSAWIKILIISSIIFSVLFSIQKLITVNIDYEALKRPIDTIVTAWSNTAFMFVLVSGFALLFQRRFFHKLLNYFTAFGKMSLSNYIFQSIIGAFLYYGFGLGLYKFTSTTYALLIGIGLTILLGIFCKWQSENFKRGPLETIWHKLTWIGTDKK